MNNQIGTVVLLSLFLLVGIFSSSAKRTAKVELWKRFEISFENSSWEGNPFDLILEATFESPSGKRYKQFGFYAGNNTWKIFFMPAEVGKWRYRTSSEDKGLDNKSDIFTCVKSSIESPLIALGKQWKLQGGKGDFPVIWSPTFRNGKHWAFRSADILDKEVGEVLQFADEVVGARVLGIGELVLAPIAWAKEWPQSSVPYVVGKEGDEFYIPFWNQLNAKLDAARDRNMGIYFMIYGDDAMTPDRFGITPHSKKELRLFRYIVARVACYPHVLWDTGIDIGEYRNNDWINWFANWFRSNDAWQHPVSSRSGGGSGGIMPQNGTYYSCGGASLPSRSQLLETYSKSEVPIAQTDHWRPFISRGNWTLEKIRIATWCCGLTGAQALYPDFNQGVVKFEEVIKAGTEIGIVTNFFRNELRYNLALLLPHDELLHENENAILAANPGKEYVVYNENGNDFSIDLTTENYLFIAEWYNPRTGEIIQTEKINGGGVHHFASPSTDTDWVLHIYRK